MPTFSYPFDRRIFGAIAAGVAIEHKVLGAERELDAHKWFAYRFLSPFDATLRFHRIYLEKRRHYVWTNIDAGLLPRLRDKSFFALDGREVTQLWMARQRADSIGLPYEAYIDFALEFWSRRSGDGYSGGRSGAPQVNQLHFSDKSKFAWVTELDKQLADLTQMAASKLAEVPELAAAAYRGEPAQRDARTCIAYLCQLSTSSWADLVRKWCYDYPIMSPLGMRNLMPRDVMKQVIQGLRTAPPSRRPSPTVAPDLRPSCFAMPSAYSGTSDVCASCSFAGSCAVASGEVIEAIEAATGHRDPRRAVLRRAANKRQRKHDAKNRASRATSLPVLAS